ncbi:MAG: AMP-binding protein [Desulfomonile sp.]|jgi:non-ribosomal peptide synthetase component E (peptide arylation enzyme)|nr:AMP-binding protein [Deltaproteobacteria bacterium]
MRPIRYTDKIIEEFRSAGYWTDETFTDFWLKNAKDRPNGEALVDSSMRITWAEAAKLMNRFALAWISMGLAKDDRVILQAPNCAYGFLARIAGERAGLINITVMPYLRHKELTHIIEKIGPRAIIVPGIYRKFNYMEMVEELKRDHPNLKYTFLLDSTILGPYPKDVYSLIDIAKEPWEQKTDPAILEQRRFHPNDDVGALTSTSGTTGVPKIVEWPLAPRVMTSKCRVEIWKLTGEDTAMAVAPFAGGAAGTLTYFAAPLVGAKIVLLEEFTPEGALEMIQKEKVTCIGVVPTHIIRMLESDLSKYDLSSLRFIRSAGGYLPPKVAMEAEDLLGGRITSDLGTQDVGSVSGCSIDDPGDVRRRTVGKPLRGNTIKLMDELGKEVPPGDPGILYMRGPHSPAGYWRDPETTREVFDDDNWTTTGDIVTLEEGRIWIMGRQKDVIIRGGQNIYPAEIEGLLNEHPKVASIAIVAMPDREFGEKACAYVVSKPGENFTFEDMASFLKSKRLAMYKLPERIEIISAMPTVGDSGKVDKKVLKRDIEEKVASEGKA